MNLKICNIVGFFSMPSKFLAEHNPTAYNGMIQTLIQQYGSNIGTCAHCGMGISNHIVVKDENGKISYIGSQCATKVGADAEQIRLRLTTDEKQAIDAAREKRNSEWRAEVAERNAMLAQRAADFADIISILESKQNAFFDSLAAQLKEGNLSQRQAHFVCKATSETGRRNKNNAAAWDEIEARCCGWNKSAE